MKRIYLLFLLLGIVGYSETELDINKAILRQAEFGEFNNVVKREETKNNSTRPYLEIETGSKLGFKFTLDRSKTNKVSSNRHNFLFDKRNVYFSIAQNFKDWRYHINIDNDYIYSKYAPYKFNIDAGIKYRFDDLGLFVALDTKPVYQYNQKYYNSNGIKNSEQRYGDVRLEVGYEVEDVAGLTLVYETPNIVELGLLGARLYINYPIKKWMLKGDILGGSNFLYHKKFIKENSYIIYQKPLHVGGYLNVEAEYNHKYFNFITNLSFDMNLHENTTEYIFNHTHYYEYIVTNIINLQSDVINLRVKPIENMYIDFIAKAYIDMMMLQNKKVRTKINAGIALETSWKYDIDTIDKIKMTPNVSFAFYKPFSVVNEDTHIDSNIYETPRDKMTYKESKNLYHYFNGMLRYTDDDNYAYNILGNIGFDFSYELTEQLDIYIKTNIETNFGKVEKQSIDKKSYYRLSVTPEFNLGIKYTLDRA